MKWVRRLLFGLILSIFLVWGLDFSQNVLERSDVEQPEGYGQNSLIGSSWAWGQHFDTKSLTKKEDVDDQDVSLHHLSLNLSVTIGMSRHELEQVLGPPDRIEPSAYGYEWWIYVDHWDYYLQVGLRDQYVNTIYTNAGDWSWQGWTIGMPYEAWSELKMPQGEISFSDQRGFFTFLLNPQEKRERPLFLINDSVAVQLYIDVHDQERIAGMRLMDLYTLLVQKPYTVRYIGSLPQPPEMDDGDMAAVEAAYERQIFELANVTRSHLSLDPFLWDSQVAAVARGHSADMAKHHYFNHHSPRYGDLGQRLEEGGITFVKAGENIAWNYVDAADVHHGWMNSPGHRKNIVEPDFTHLGVGVVERYFTQNFVQAASGFDGES